MFGWIPEPFENVTDLIAEMESRGAPTHGVAEQFVPGKVFIACQGLVRIHIIVYTIQYLMIVFIVAMSI